MEIKLNIDINDELLEDMINNFVTVGYDSFSDCIVDVLDGYSLERESTYILNINEIKAECRKLVNKWFDEGN
jgi:hypothetical protein